MKSSDIRKYILPFIIIFLSAAAIFRPQLLTWLWEGLSGAASPLIIGIIIAAITSPAVAAFERLISRLCANMRARAVRCAAIAAVYIITAAAAAAAVGIIIPKVIDSAALFIGSLDGYYNELKHRFDAASGNDPLGLMGIFEELITLIGQRLPYLFEKTFNFTGKIIRSAADFAVGAVLSVYILAGREQITDFIGGAAKAVMSEKHRRRAELLLKTFYSCLSSFISGQLAEAVVLGTLCFAGMLLFDFEYPLLISTIIGVTALIPVVGAFAGAIPSALMLFLAKPSSALWFILFIIILQQLENNLIYPKIVGKSVGLPPILILIAIIIGAKAGGAAGMILGIPVISTVYTLIAAGIKNECRCAEDKEK